METKELMQLDWVCLEDDPTPRQVDFIRTGEVGLYWNKIVTPPYIKPIPITPEILEKNEFKNDGKDKNMYYWNWSICNNCISYDKETGKIRIFHSLGDLVFVLPLRYVHELQHALKLCKIQKEIVL